MQKNTYYVINKIKYVKSKKEYSKYLQALLIKYEKFPKYDLIGSVTYLFAYMQHLFF